MTVGERFRFQPEQVQEAEAAKSETAGRTKTASPLCIKLALKPAETPECRPWKRTQGRPPSWSRQQKARLAPTSDADLIKFPHAALGSQNQSRGMG